MRNLKMKKTTTKPIKRKCYSCGKMATNPYVYHVVPPHQHGIDLPVYSKSAPKTDRLELRGGKKVEVYNYCNYECKIENPPTVR
jgi:hypothetical protein|tara:strand:- start:669 stop:920 length:252 start_codon:yes stop_codon:yes gene_type:complete